MWICSTPNVAGDIISGEDVKNVRIYLILKFELISSNSFQDNPRKHLVVAPETAADINGCIQWNNVFLPIPSNWWKLLRVIFLLKSACQGSIEEWTVQSLSSLSRIADGRSRWTAEASVGVPQRRPGVREKASRELN